MKERTHVTTFILFPSSLAYFYLVLALQGDLDFQGFT